MTEKQNPLSVPSSIGESVLQLYLEVSGYEKAQCHRCGQVFAWRIGSPALCSFCRKGN